VHEYPPLPQPGQQGGYPGNGPTFPGDLRPPPDHEPEWCRGGSYMVVRSSALTITPWDDATLGAQEQTIGRFKFSGASLDLSDDPAQLNAEPAFVANQADTRVPFDSHVRKVNPRRPEDAPRRIFRRGFPLVDATVDGVRRGLVFICFARTLSTQFEFIERAWTTNRGRSTACSASIPEKRSPSLRRPSRTSGASSQRGTAAKRRGARTSSSGSRPSSTSAARSKSFATASRTSASRSGSRTSSPRTG
jgi:hypothetical protein